MPLIEKLILLALGLFFLILGGGLLALAAAAKLPVITLPIPGSGLGRAFVPLRLTFTVDVEKIIRALTGFSRRIREGALSLFWSV